MLANFKQSTLLFIIFIGLVIFVSNALKLDLSKNILTQLDSSKNKENIINSNENLKQNEIKNIIKLDNKFIQNDEKKYNKVLITVKKGQTFSKILDDISLKNEKKFEIINSINQLFNLKKLNIGQKILFYLNNEDEIRKIKLELDYKTDLIVEIDKDIKTKILELETIFDTASNEFLIKNSLYSDGKINGIPDEILIKLIQLFSFDLDFQRDIIKDTLVSVSYQKIYVEDKSNSYYGDLEYAKISVKKNELEYFKFITDDGYKDYFNREGKNVKKSLLKTPLDGAKLSSNFGMRKHPILGYNKMHKGIDFAAPRGTPVYAGGNGVIEIAARNGSYGKYIRIRHNNGYKTAYAHLSGYKKGISKGIRVNQGEVIGYVGSTGRSTGPHLHYEIIYQGKQINPMKLKLPSGKILENDEFKRFEKSYKVILANHLNNLFE